MSKWRAIYFELDDRNQHFDFGTYALLMYYAKSVNSRLAKKFLDSTFSEYEYRIIYDLSVDTLDEESRTAHFIASEIQEIIEFLEQELIPSLENESRNLFEKYGSKENFYELFYSNVEFLDPLGIYHDECYNDEPKGLIFLIKILIRFMQSALSLNIPYSVFVK